MVPACCVYGYLFNKFNCQTFGEDNIILMLSVISTISSSMSLCWVRLNSNSSSYSEKFKTPMFVVIHVSHKDDSRMII